jgi:hypothetical protein
VFDARSNISAQLSIAEILQFDCHSHSTAFYRPGVLPISGANRSTLSTTGLLTHHEHAYPTIDVENRGCNEEELSKVRRVRRLKKRVRLLAIICAGQ